MQNRLLAHQPLHLLLHLLQVLLIAHPLDLPFLHLGIHATAQELRDVTLLLLLLLLLLHVLHSSATALASTYARVSSAQVAVLPLLLPLPPQQEEYVVDQTT